ncbi:hypothetical protein GW17_00057148 [Ensete ventricosum]|nr:hypothetical protein GW17_00057148 [Ensete ventricosum]
MVEATITSAVPVLYSRPHRVGSFEESLLLDLEKNLSPSGVERDIDDRGTVYSPLSVLLLGSPGGGPQEESARGCSLRESVEYKESVSGSESYGLTHWVRALDTWLRCPRGPDPNPGRNGVDCQWSGSLEAANFVAALLLSGTGRLLEVVGSAVG